MTATKSKITFLRTIHSHERIAKLIALRTGKTINRHQTDKSSQEKANLEE